MKKKVLLVDDSNTVILMERMILAKGQYEIVVARDGEIARADAEHQNAGRSLAAVETDVASEVASAYEEFESARQLLIETRSALYQVLAGECGGVEREELP